MISALIDATSRSLSRFRLDGLWLLTPARLHAVRWEIAAVGVLVAIAAVLRFWGLGSWGLEYDEETMAMSAAHIIGHGYPALPSGMTYVRGFVQLYFMAGAAMLFGENEWAWRLPSALCGLLLIVLAYYQGRRFLVPLTNVAFVATVAFLPALILDSQEARMYIFLVTSIVAFTLFVFRWERTGQVRELVFAVATMALAIQFQALAIFSSFVLFFPGLARGDSKKLLQGTVAFVISVALFLGITEWTNSFYPPSPDRVPGTEEQSASVLSIIHPGVIVVGVALAGVLANLIRRSIAVSAASWSAAALILAGFAAQLALHYHIAIILFLAGVVLALRFETPAKWLVGVAIVSLGIACAHVAMLHASGFGWSRKLVGAMVGQPSVWPYFRFATYAPPAALLVLAGIGFALRDITRQRRVPDVWLYAVLAIWVPLFLVGFFAWYMPVRYTQFALIPMLMCAFAVLPGALNRAEPQSGSTNQQRWKIAAVVIAAIATINPYAAALVVNAGYSIHPDHKGAAEFIRAQKLQPSDIVVAEDVLQQTYYLGRVDYWLVGKNTAAQFTREFDGRVLDIYTHTPVLDTGESLQALLERSDRGAVYIIGSGEQQEDGRAHARSHGIQEVLRSGRLQEVYLGRDRLTKVWMTPATHPAQAPEVRSGTPPT